MSVNYIVDRRQPVIGKRPRGVATRLLTSILCFGSFVFWSVYTARLTAQFVQRRMHFAELHDAADLLRVKDIRFGYVANTSAQLFLQVGTCSCREKPHGYGPSLFTLLPRSTVAARGVRAHI